MAAGIDLEAAAAGAVEAAIAAGAADAEAYVEEATGREVRVHGGEVESLTEATERGIGLRAWIDGRAGYAYATELDEGSIEALGSAAAEAARISDPDEFAAPPDAAAPAALDGLRDPAFADASTPDVVSLALEVESAAIGRDERLRAVEQAVYADSENSVAIHSSRGARGSYEATTCYAYAHALAGTGDEQQTGLGFGVARAPAALDPEAIGHEAADRAVGQLGAGKPASGERPVVLDPTVAASFVSYIGGVMGADAVQRGRSPLAGRLGDEIAAVGFELADDGLDPDGPGSSPFDDEGTPRGRTPLIEGGRLQAYLHDAYTARRGDAAPTGNAARAGYRSPPSVAPSNLIVGPGEAAFDALLGEADGGVYVAEVAGLHSGVNPVSGVFSVGATGRAIEGGELGQPLREFTIASDLLSMLAAVAAAGNEPRWVPFGASVSTPPLLVSEMTVSGT